MALYPVILSGGSGTRLWPLSRAHYPKQFLPLVNQHSLFQDTALRLDGLSELADPLIVCNEAHRFTVLEQLHDLAKSPAVILLEPGGRNTAPALTLSALWLQEKAGDQDALVAVMPSDHIIRDAAGFRAVIQAGLTLAQAGKLVTFGIVPDAPHTGYGYIKQGPGRAVAAFVEKPDRATAETYLASGDYLWNSGIFLMKASVWLDQINRFRQDIWQHCEAAFGAGMEDGAFYRVDQGEFLSCPAESIDYAVMEHTEDAVVLPLEVGWSDVGDWASLWEVQPQVGQNNAVRGDVLTHDARDSLLFAQHRLLAAVGVRDLVVIETADAVLVASKDCTQEIKELVDQLKQGNREEYKTHRRVNRPWGAYEVMDQGERFQVKRITVKPGASLSLQMHHHRAEHWIVVRGTAKVTRGGEVFLLSENQSSYIPLGEIHRLENPGLVPLEMIEVQSGDYLGEDDIVRFEDRYNRNPDE